MSVFGGKADINGRRCIAARSLDHSINWRGHHPSATELTNWSEPNASWRVPMPRTHRCGRIHLSRRDSHHEALSKTRSRDGLARTSGAYAEGLADEYLGKILQVRR
jgi:hypothetical protein